MNGKAHYSENSTELMSISSSLCLNLLTHKTNMYSTFFRVVLRKKLIKWIGTTS